MDEPTNMLQCMGKSLATQGMQGQPPAASFLNRTIAGLPLWLIGAMVALLTVGVLFWIVIRWWHHRLDRGQREALRVLQVRFAQGEIAAETYREQADMIRRLPVSPGVVSHARSA